MSINSLDVGYCPRCGTTHYLGEYCPTQPPTIMSRCTRHNSYFFGPSCYFCDEDARRTSRDALNVLEARIADQDDQISGLRRQINTLEHIARDLQRAHNALVDHVRPNEDLLP